MLLAMNLTISDELALAAQVTESDARLLLARALFEDDKLTLAQAARLAGLDRLAFQRYLAARGIETHYRTEDLEEDLEVLAHFSGA